MSLRITSPATPDAVGFTIALTADVASIGLPRKLAEWALGGWGLAHVADTASLVMCELTTNACRETPGAQIWARVTLRSDGVLVECWDRSPKIPGPATLANGDSESGRGLWLVELLSVKSGIEETPAIGGKVIWSLISREPQEAAVG
jgi:hypothetical protein